MRYFVNSVRRLPLPLRLIVTISLNSIHLSFAIISLIFDFIQEFIFLISTSFQSQSVNPVGKAIVISGCSSGLGQQLAIKFDSIGFSVFAIVKTIDHRSEQLVNRCSSQLRVIKADVTSQSEINEAIKEVDLQLTKRQLTLHSLLSNSGIADFHSYDCHLELYEKAINVNYLGAVRFITGFSRLLSTEDSRIIIISSLSSKFNLTGFISYSASKAALSAFASSLRRELSSKNCKVFTIEPMSFKSELSSRTSMLDNLRTNCEHVENFANYENAIKLSTRLGHLDIDDVIDCVLGCTIYKSTPQSELIVSGLVQSLIMTIVNFWPPIFKDWLFFNTTVLNFLHRHRIEL